jgi:ribosome-binding factor A
MAETGRGIRLGASIRAELADIIAREVKDPRVHAAGLLSVTRVDLSPDLRAARVFVSFTGSDAEGAAAVVGLTSAVGFIRGEVAHRLSLRRAPELRFFHDKTVEAVARIDALLKGGES